VAVAFITNPFLYFILISNLNVKYFDRENITAYQSYSLSEITELTPCILGILVETAREYYG
jgi:hypothetical protein